MIDTRKVVMSRGYILINKILGILTQVCNQYLRNEKGMIERRKDHG